jgi:hypothetical protein
MNKRISFACKIATDNILKKFEKPFQVMHFMLNSE